MCSIGHHLLLMIPLWDIEINRYIETETEIKIPNSTIPLSKCWIETNPSHVRSSKFEKGSKCENGSNSNLPELHRKEVNKNQFRAFHRRADGEALFFTPQKEVCGGEAL